MSTPLIINPVSTAPVSTEGDPSDEYFIGVKSIRVDGKVVNFDNSLLTINKNGNGGTKLSTITLYTVLQSSIHKALVSTFVMAAKARKMKRVASVAPFWEFSPIKPAFTLSFCITNSTNGMLPLALTLKHTPKRGHKCHSLHPPSFGRLRKCHDHCITLVSKHIRILKREDKQRIDQSSSWEWDSAHEKSM
ncbi:hypothetical protein LguiB_014280 [Lonicera macranthoides]